MTHRTYGYWSHAYAAVVEASHTKHSDFSSPEITKERELNLFVTCWQLLSCRNVQGFFHSSSYMRMLSKIHRKFPRKFAIPEEHLSLPHYCASYYFWLNGAPVQKLGVFLDGILRTAQHSGAVYLTWGDIYRWPVAMSWWWALTTLLNRHCPEKVK